MSTNVSAVTSHAGSPDASFISQQQQRDDGDDVPPQPHNAAPTAQPTVRTTKARADAQPSVVSTPTVSNNCFTIDSPPPPPPQFVKSEKQQTAAANLLVDTCHFCSVDSVRILSELSRLQFEVSKLNMRMDLHDERGSSDRAQIDKCLSQLNDYSVSLGVVGKWTSSVGAAIPRLLRSMAATATTVEPSQVLVRSEAAQQTSLVAAASAIDRSAVAHKQENVAASETAAALPPRPAAASFSRPADQSSMNGSELLTQSVTAAYIPISEVRTMFSQFRDEVIRLKERNEVLEQRLNDAVCKFEGSNINKIKADVEGRLRTMLHSLHETMNSGGSGGATMISELAEQVSSLRTEVELVKSKTEASISARSVIEARLNDTAAKLREMADGQQEHRRYEQMQASAQKDELKDLRSAVKELGTAVSQRLDTERSAREFESGDIRSQLRVLLRSPSPMARLGDSRSPAFM